MTAVTCADCGRVVDMARVEPRAVWSVKRGWHNCTKPMHLDALRTASGPRIKWNDGSIVR